MKIHNFCTLFDANYLIKGVAMLRSLKANCAEASIYVLCMDEATFHLLTELDLPGVTCISLAEFEDSEMLQAKRQRSVAEYCWTLSPCLPWYLMQNHQEMELITYLDADLYFYSSLKPVFDEIGSASISIIEHRFPPHMKHYEVNGRFCVQWVSFRRDQEGLACLNHWRNQCLEWCYYRVENGKMGDQKYLDEWPDLYQNLHIIEHVGAGVAPWNYIQYRFEVGPQAGIKVDGRPLIFYHFHQFQILNNGSFDRLSTFYTDVCHEPEMVYRAYESEIRSALDKIRTVSPDFALGMKPAPDNSSVISDATSMLPGEVLQKRMKRLMPKRVRAWISRLVS